MGLYCEYQPLSGPLHYGLHTRHVTVFRDALVTRGFNRFVASTVAQVASGWSISPGRTLTHWKAPPFHGAPPKAVVLAGFSVVPKSNIRGGGSDLPSWEGMSGAPRLISASAAIRQNQ